MPDQIAIVSIDDREFATIEPYRSKVSTLPGWKLDNRSQLLY